MRRISILMLVLLTCFCNGGVVVHQPCAKLVL
jgi:hypothetical protein